MRIPIIGILVPYLVFCAMYQNRAYDFEVIVAIQITFMVIMTYLQISFVKNFCLTRHTLHILITLLINLFLVINYLPDETLSSDEYNFPPREIYLDLKVDKKMNGVHQDKFFQDRYLAHFINMPPFLPEEKNNTIVCEFKNFQKNLSKRNIRVKGIISRNKEKFLYIKRCILLSVKPYTFYEKSVSEIRTYIQNTFKAADSEKYQISNILNAIFLGNKNMLSLSEKKSYQYSGTMHLFAVSGLHIGFLYLIFKFICALFFTNKLISEIIIIIIMLIYLELIYYPPSAVRATMMLFFWQCTTILSKRKNVFSTLLLSCIVLLLIEPSNIQSIGFQLSYTVVLSILVYSKTSAMFKNFKINSSLRFVINTMLTSFSAFTGSFLLVYDYFNLVVPISIFINLFAIPIAFLFIIISFSMLCLHSIIGIEIFAHTLYLLHDLLTFIIQLCTFENITFFKINEHNDLNDSVHLVFPVFCLFYFISPGSFILKSFIFLMIPLSLLLFYSIVI